MSGSKDKQRRRNQREQGFDFRNPKEVEAEKKRKKQTRTAITVLVVFAIVAVFLLIIDSNLFYRNMTALNVEGERFTITDMNYFFTQAGGQVRQEDHTGLIDWDANLRNQMMPDGDQTVFDHILERAVTLATQQTVFYQGARAAGLTLDGEFLEQVEESMQWYEENHLTAIPNQPFPTANSLIAWQFGRGMNTRILQERLEFEMLGFMYIDHVGEALEAAATLAEVEAFYQENIGDFERFIYRIHFISYTPAERAEEGEVGTTREEAEEQADLIVQRAEAEGEEGFIAAVREVLPEMFLDFFEDEHTMSTTFRSAAEERSYGEWLLDGQRRRGDVTVVEDEGLLQVLYFLEVDDNDYYTTNVRHILISPEPVDPLDADGEPIDPELVANRESLALAEARIEAERILALWESGPGTEAHFTELALEYSDDPSVVMNEGLFEDINRQSGFVTPFRDWAMDTSRRVGDVDIVETQFGYHIMYFAGYNDEAPFWQTMARQAMVGEAHSAWFEEMTEKEVSARTTIFSRFVARG